MAGVLLVILAASRAHAAPRTLSAEVAYSFSDKNGFGWVAKSGTVTVTLTFVGKGGSLQLRGKRQWVDSQMVAGKTPGGPPDMKTTRGESDVDETFPLRNVARTGAAITFELDAVHDHLTGSCTATKVPKLTSATLYECAITGFQWHASANLPELHHPIVLDANVRAKTRILNMLGGAAAEGLGQRTVSEAKKPATRP